MLKVTTAKLRLVILLAVLSVAVYRAGWQVPAPIVHGDQSAAAARNET